MSSGKSTLITEYLHAFDSIDFTPPPVTVTYKGLNFEFIDSVFAIEEGDNKFNFYELDAPTISKWFQFIEVADAVVVVYNDNPRIEYGTHDSLANAVFPHVKPTTPIIFIVNNYDDFEIAKSNLHSKYNLDQYHDYNVVVTSVSKGEPFFDNRYGNRVKLDINELESMVNLITKTILES